jgi:hypothetical protein
VQNLSIGKDLGDQNAVVELAFAPSSAVGLGELLGQGGDDLFAIFGALALEDFGVDAVADLPVKQGDFGVDGNRRAVFGLVDELSDFLEEGVLREVIAHGLRPPPEQQFEGCHLDHDLTYPGMETLI